MASREAIGERDRLIDELRSAAGVTESKAEETAKEREARPFGKRLEDLRKDADDETKDALKDVKSKKLINDVKKDFESLEAAKKLEIAAKEKIPSNDLLQKVFESSTADERLKLDYKIIENAFKNAECVKTEGTPPNVREILSLDNVKEGYSSSELKITLADEAKWDTIRSETDKPKIMFVPIERQMTSFEKLKTKMGGDIPDLRTGEVLVVISLNNGANENTNSVVTMVAKHKGGQLEFDTAKNPDGKTYRGPDGGRNGLFRVQSEKEYKDLLRYDERPGKPNQDEKVARGETTHAEYHDKYRDSNGKKITEHWKAWDKQVANNYDEKDVHAAAKRTERDNNKAEVMAALEGKYTQELKNLQERANRIVVEVQAEVDAIIERNNEILANPGFVEVMALEDGGTGKSKGALLAKKLLARNLRISLPELEAYINLARNRKKAGKS